MTRLLPFREERKKEDTRKLREGKVESEKKLIEEIKKLKMTLELKDGEVQERAHHIAALSRELEKARKEMEGTILRRIEGGGTFVPRNH